MKGQHILMPGSWACYWKWGCWETIIKGRYLVQSAVGCFILHIALLEVSRTGTAVHSILVKIRISPSGHCFLLPSRTVKCWIWLWTFLFSHIAFPYRLGFGWGFWKDQSVFDFCYSTHYHVRFWFAPTVFEGWFYLYFCKSSHMVFHKSTASWLLSNIMLISYENFKLKLELPYSMTQVCTNNYDFYVVEGI